MVVPFPDKSTESRLRHMAIWCGGLVVGLTVLSLLGWFFKIIMITSIRPQYIPIASSTALALLIQGAVLILQAKAYWTGRRRQAAGLAIVSLAAIYGLLTALKYFIGVDLTFENVMFPDTEHFGAVMTNRMSPITGAVVCLSSLSLFFILRPWQQGFGRYLPGVLGGLVTFSGFIVVIGYLFGTPVLYGSTIIPVAAMTAVAFVLLGVGLVAAAGQDSFPIRGLVGPSTQARLLRTFLPITIFAILSYGFVHGVFERHSSGTSFILITALLAVAFAMVTSLAVILTGRNLGKALDQAQGALKRSERRKAILNRISLVFLTMPDEEMYEKVLEIVREVMESKLGVFGFIADNGDLVIPSMTREIWVNCIVPGKSFIFPAATWGHSLWGKAIREQKTFCADGPFQILEGHIHIDNFLTSPIVFGGKTIGIISLANRSRGYTDEDKDLLEGITEFVSPILNARLQRDRQAQQRQQAEEEIIRQREELRGLAARLAEVKEGERQQLAQELHDQVCQNLTSITIALETIMMRSQSESREQLLSRLSDVTQVAEQTNEITRSIMENLRPTILDHYGLMGGLRQLGSQFSQRTGIKLDILGAEPNSRLSPNVELALFRIAQEALNNVVKHAQATHVVLTIETDQDTLRLIISDNGSGFDQDLVAHPTEGRGWGLMTMTERARAVGGHCRIESQHGQGTRVVVEVPR